MLASSATIRRTKTLAWWPVCFAITLSSLSSGAPLSSRKLTEKASLGSGSQHLYLLAGTPTYYAPATFPVRLYAVGSHQELLLVREIVSPHDGLFAVRDDSKGKLYISYPHDTPTTVSVIHKDRPTLRDEVTFNPGGLTVANSLFGVAAGEGLQSYALFPAVRRFEGPQSESLLSVRGDASANKPRVELNDWSEYRSLRYAGCPGGPESEPQPVGIIADKHIVMQTGGSQTEVDITPLSFGAEENSRRAAIFAASQRFFVFSIQHTNENRFAPTLIHVHDRQLNRWKDLNFTASSPCSRIFRSWLATIVEVWKGHGVPDDNPGHQDERNRWTPLLPNVSDEYAMFRGAMFNIPGTLLLDNLEDGRRITLQTNEEDSEIIDVRSDGLVLYRINDSIFSAQIEGNKLGAPTLVVKDDDVPEVHWAFWSPAPASVNPSKPPASGH